MLSDFNFAIAEHYANVESAINYLVDLYYDDVDIADANIFNQVMQKYDLNDDGFESEREYIIQEVSNRLGANA